MSWFYGLIVRGIISLWCLAVGRQGSSLGAYFWKIQVCLKEQVLSNSWTPYFCLFVCYGHLQRSIWPSVWGIISLWCLVVGRRWSSLGAYFWKIQVYLSEQVLSNSWTHYFCLFVCYVHLQRSIWSSVWGIISLWCLAVGRQGSSLGAYFWKIQDHSMVQVLSNLWNV